VQFPGAIALVALRQGEPVGRLILDTGDRRWRLIDIVLLPSWRGQGIGSEPDRGGRARASQAGAADELCLSELSTNLAAHRLYGCLGFVETGRDDTHIAIARQLDR
jgi:GNAT superfamily N-acetyltransferase